MAITCSFKFYATLLRQYLYLVEIKSLPKVERDEIILKIKEIEGLLQRQAARIPRRFTRFYKGSKGTVPLLL